MVDKLRRLLSLSPIQRRVLAEALVMVPVASVALKLGGLRCARNLLARHVRRHAARHGLEAAGIARLVAIASRHGPVRARCLARAVALESLLHRYGVRGELRLGVRRHEGHVEAHAWVEHDGIALSEPEGVQSRYAAFAGPLEAPR